MSMKERTGCLLLFVSFNSIMMYLATISVKNNDRDTSKKICIAVKFSNFLINSLLGTR